MNRLILTNALIVLILMISGDLIYFNHAYANEKGLGWKNIQTSPVSKELQGLYPISRPELNGVEEIIILSDSWVIVVTNNMKRLVSEINVLSDGKLNNIVNLWVNSRDKARPNWTARHKARRLREKHLLQARLNIGENQMGEPGYFSIQSEQDKNFNRKVLPSRAERVFVSAGMSRNTDSVFNIDYNIYSYLEFPTPMVEGATYTITLKDGRKASFLYDRKKSVSRTIKVNQAGYLVSARKKFAYLGGYLYQYGPLDLSHVDKFEVINVQTGHVALSGDVKLIEKNPLFFPKKNESPSSRPMMYGEDVYAIDLSDLKEEGNFFISVPGVGRSWPFRVSDAVYGDAFYTSIRGLYHQRAGIPITEKYSSWTRQKVHRAPYCESQHIFFPKHTGGELKKYDRFDVIGATTDCSKTREEVPGGWHDAADWDSNGEHYTVLFDLLNAYAFSPEKFSDGQLNIPESGNGMPDILDEAWFGLELWRHSMNDKGGVSGMLETWTHPKMDNRKVRYSFSVRTRWSSLMFAAAAAQFAQFSKPFNETLSKAYQDAAIRAYLFGIDEANSLGTTVINAKKKRGKGKAYSYVWTEKEKHVVPYLLHAKLRLYLLTGDKSYLDGIERLEKISRKPYQWKFTRSDFSPWIFYSLIEASDALPESLKEKWVVRFTKDADDLLEQQKESPYPMTWPRKRDFWLAWGASNMSNFNRSLFIAYKLTGDEKYRDAAILNMDFMLGANPMGMSWTTGIGFVYPIDIQHEMSESDGIFDPVPGISVYGINGGTVYHKFRKLVWTSLNQDKNNQIIIDDSNKKPPLWRRWMVHPHENVGQNEFTIQETMSGMIFSTALLIEKNWKPEQGLLKRKPRQENSLYGRWYLP